MTSSARFRRPRHSSQRSSVTQSRVGGDATDCSALVEAQGGRVTVVEGDPRLLKVTTADDLALVESWLDRSDPL